MIKVLYRLMILSIISVLAVMTYELWTRQQALAYAFIEFKKPGDRFTKERGDKMNERLKFVEGFIASCQQRRKERKDYPCAD